MSEFERDKQSTEEKEMLNYDAILLRANSVEGIVKEDIVDFPDAEIMQNNVFYSALNLVEEDDIFTLSMPVGTDGFWEKLDEEYGIR